MSPNYFYVNRKNIAKKSETRCKARHYFISLVLQFGAFRLVTYSYLKLKEMKLKDNHYMK